MKQEPNCESCKFYSNDGWCELLFLENAQKYPQPCVDYEQKEDQ